MHEMEKVYKKKKRKKSVEMGLGWPKLHVCNAKYAAEEHTQVETLKFGEGKKVCGTLGTMAGENSVLRVAEKCPGPIRGSSTAFFFSSLFHFGHACYAKAYCPDPGQDPHQNLNITIFKLPYNL